MYQHVHVCVCVCMHTHTQNYLHPQSVRGDSKSAVTGEEEPVYEMLLHHPCFSSFDAEHGFLHSSQAVMISL